MKLMKPNEKKSLFFFLFGGIGFMELNGSVVGPFNWIQRIQINGWLVMVDFPKQLQFNSNETIPLIFYLLIQLSFLY